MIIRVEFDDRPAGGRDDPSKALRQKRLRIARYSGALPAMTWLNKAPAEGGSGLDDMRHCLRLVSQTQPGGQGGLCGLACVARCACNGRGDPFGLKLICKKVSYGIQFTSYSQFIYPKRYKCLISLMSPPS